MNVHIKFHKILVILSIFVNNPIGGLNFYFMPEMNPKNELWTSLHQ